jgi:hypothetical protein
LPMAKKPTDLDETKRLMGALVRMKPKPHEEMKVGARPKKSRPPKRAPRAKVKKRPQ